MISVPYGLSLIDQFALAIRKVAPTGYYRSKLFVMSGGVNPLISAAGPIFSLLERIGMSKTLPDIKNIRSNIEHELLAFQNRLQRKGASDELILIAHYLMCATIDELLGKNYLRVHGSVVDFVAFTPLSSDNQGPERIFFEIVHVLKEKTNQYLDLIELTYYCLITGFEGEKHFQSDGRQVLENLIEELHQLINHHRVHKPYHLFTQRITPLPKHNPHQPMMIALFTTLATIMLLFYGSHTWVTHKAKQILAHHPSNFVTMDTA